ncbi:MAG TPA: hypothetical protein VK196_11055 [Magnetospirillum sp.]|nr:hypothetical protein [Magnetospirillum sp.]
MNAASALESLAHRLVAVHHRKAAAESGRRPPQDIIDIPAMGGDDGGLDAPPAVPHPSFLDRVRHFFSG